MVLTVAAPMTIAIDDVIICGVGVAYLGMEGIIRIRKNPCAACPLSDLPYEWWAREPLTPGRLFHRGSLSCFVTPFVFRRTEVVQSAVPSGRIIEHLDVLE